MAMLDPKKDYHVKNNFRKVCKNSTSLNCCGTHWPGCPRCDCKCHVFNLPEGQALAVVAVDNLIKTHGSTVLNLAKECLGSWTNLVLEAKEQLDEGKTPETKTVLKRGMLGYLYVNDAKKMVRAELLAVGTMKHGGKEFGSFKLLAPFQGRADGERITEYLRDFIPDAAQPEEKPGAKGRNRPRVRKSKS